MKNHVLIALSLLVYSVTLAGQPEILDRRVRIENLEGTIASVLDEISRNGGFWFSYSQDIPRNKKVRLQHHLQTVQQHLDEIFNGPDVSDDFSLYLHAPTLTDQSVAPEGCEAFYVLSPVPHLGNAPVDWSEEGPRYRDKILAYLEKRYLPNLRADIETVRIITPDHFKNTLNSHLGSAFSLEPILTQSAWFRVHNRDRKIGGLYFAGAGTHPGAGVPGVVNSAKATAGLMIGDLLGEGS